MPTVPSPAVDADVAVQRLVAFFETLTPDGVAQLAQHYAPHARFKDPFNDVTGLAAISGIFSHMFVALEQPRFVVHKRVMQGRDCFLTWDFHFGFRNFKRGQPQAIRGATHLVLSDAGLVELHRDYWDAAEEVYEKLPGIGSLMRWLKRRANA